MSQPPRKISTFEWVIIAAFGVYLVACISVWLGRVLS